MGSPGFFPVGGGASLPPPSLGSATIHVRSYARERDGRTQWVSSYDRHGINASLHNDAGFWDFIDRLLLVPKAQAQEVEPPVEGELSELKEEPKDEEQGEPNRSDPRLEWENLQQQNRFAVALQVLRGVKPDSPTLTFVTGPNYVPPENMIENVWKEVDYWNSEKPSQPEPDPKEEGVWARIGRGIEFDRRRREAYPYNEIYIEKEGGGYCRLDSYNRYEIVSRKYTQLSRIEFRTAEQYLREFGQKYSVGARLAAVKSNESLREDSEFLTGHYVLEVPAQRQPVPPFILDLAQRYEVTIRDEYGRIYK